LRASTSTSALRAAARACFEAALAAVEPGRLVTAALGREGDRLALHVGSQDAVHRGPVILVGAGKAARAMACAAATIVQPRSGIVIVPHDQRGATPEGVQTLQGAHPVPDAAGEVATARLVALVETAAADTLVLVLLSGGGSSLLVSPASGILLADKQAMTAALLASGADIGALNTVRRHCSGVKGGGLLRAARHARAVWTLLLSDVVDDDPATIASGPTAADRTTYDDALCVLHRWLAPEAVPPRVRARLESGAAGALPETVKPGDPLLARTRLEVLADNRTAVAAAAEAARRAAFEPLVLPEPLVGDAAAAGRHVAARLMEGPSGRAVAVIAGGETTVRAVPGGRGGRSQHLALAAAVALDGHDGVVLAAGTDGTDGPTDAAGACVDGGTARRARASGFDVNAALAATDSHPVLAATGDLVRTGPSGTNVADLVVALRPAC
jgi:glycerate-2-kinase